MRAASAISFMLDKAELGSLKLSDRFSIPSRPIYAQSLALRKILIMGARVATGPSERVNGASETNIHRVIMTIPHGPGIMELGLS